MHAIADDRHASLLAWLTSLPSSLRLDPASLRPASSDASFRRYFRIDGGDTPLIVMDAPPERENSQAFIAVAHLLQSGGLSVPKIIEQNLDEGFLLLSDLGPTTYYEALQHQPSATQVHEWYLDALNALIKMQQVKPLGLPLYDSARLADELSLFPQWYIETHCGLRLEPTEAEHLQNTFDILAQRNSAQPIVLVHRDFHSPNLMLPLAGREHEPGILDFQDALAGPITYDLVSLLMDARTTWDEPQQLDWGIRYWEAARKAGLPVAPDIAQFHADWEWMGLQRNLRILGVFARLHHRDGKAHYLQHMPRVNQYVRQVASHYDIFRPLLRLLDKLDDRLASQ